MKIGGAKFDINGIRCTADGAENQVFSLTVLIFGIQSLSIVRHLWTDISSALRDITPELKEEVPAGNFLRTGPPSPPTSFCAIDLGEETQPVIREVKFNVGVMPEVPPAEGDARHILKVTVSDMKTMETVETVSRAISQILCAIDEQLELKDARGEGPTIN